MVKRPSWFKVGLTVTATVAALTSAVYLISLAGRLGWDGLSRLGLPVSLDVLAALAISVWLNRAAPKAKRILARRIALGCLAVSVVGNAVEHVFRTAETGSGYGMGALSVLIGTVAPLAAFLGFWLAEGDLGAKPVPVVRTAPASTVEPKAAETKPRPVQAKRPQLVSSSAGSKRTGTPEQVAEWIRSQPAKPTKRQVTDTWAVGGTKALELIRAGWPDEAEREAS